MTIIRKISCHLFCSIIFVIVSCQQSQHLGDFTILTQQDKYESLGGVIKTDGHAVRYKNKPINWTQISTSYDDPNIENYTLLNSDTKGLLVEVANDYYLLVPNGDDVSIKFIAEASRPSGVFISKRYTELLSNDKFFHQPGMLINLQTFKKDSVLPTPGGRFLVADAAATKIIYIDGVFENDTNLKTTLDAAQNYSQTGIYTIKTTFNDSSINILEWDVAKSEQYKCTYTDTALWNVLDKYYDINSYTSLSKSFDSAFVFKWFKWEKDSIGAVHLIPQKAVKNAINFTKINDDSNQENKN